MKSEAMDRRVKLTLMLLQDALIKTMQSTHISKISVKQLCEMADINRSTFYAHFQDQYGLLEYICTQAIDNIEKHLEKQDINESMPITLTSLKRIFDYIKENSDLFKALLSNNCDVDFQRNIVNVVIKYSTYEVADSRTKDYLAAFGLAGCVSILQMWLKDGMPESTTRMAEIILKAINNGITSFR
jgi:AcrR family transcriptional regulator